MSKRIFLFSLLAASTFFSSPLVAQQLNLEGQTGGFITPTAYVVPSAKGQFFSLPAVGYHFIDASAVIGDVQTFNITEGFANRAEIGYTRSYHTGGNSPAFSGLWNYSGMNVFHGKVVALKEGSGGKFMPGIAVGGVLRTNDSFVSGAIYQIVHQTPNTKSYNNGDAYVVATKTWLKPPVPVVLNFGWKATNGVLFGIGGQNTGFSGRFFGGFGIPLPGPWKTAIVPSAGFTQQPSSIKNINYILSPGTRAHIPTTLDYAVRITQRDYPHFSIDAGIGQVAGQIGTTQVIVLGTPFQVPVNLKARHVFGMGISFRP